MNDLPRRLRTVSGRTCIEAADALEKQQAEIERLNNKYEALRGVMRTYEQQQLAMAQADDEVIAALKAQAVKDAADAADAGRYRWLSEYLVSDRTDVDAEIVSCIEQIELDTAIDYAMKESKQ